MLLWCGYTRYRHLIYAIVVWCGCGLVCVLVHQGVCIVSCAHGAIVCSIMMIVQVVHTNVLGHKMCYRVCFGHLLYDCTFANDLALL